MNVKTQKNYSALARELRRVVQRLVNRYRPERIILSGSMARENVHRWSDIDLAIIKKTRRRFIDRLGDALLQANPKEAVDVVVYTLGEIQKMEADNNPFWIHEIKEKGRTLYQRG